jgi:hypothetical protein
MRAHLDVAVARVGIRANIPQLTAYWNSVQPAQVFVLAAEMGRDAAEANSIAIRALLFRSPYGEKLSEGTLNKHATLWRTAPDGAVSKALTFLLGEDESAPLSDFTSIGQLSAAVANIHAGKSPYPEVSDRLPKASITLRTLGKLITRLVRAFTPGNFTGEDLRGLLEAQALINALVEAAMPTTEVPSTTVDAEEASV